ncbi:hypothetical protein ACFLTH_07495 [Bacteroidota bacterium]
MTKQKIGLVLVCIALIWAVVWGLIGSLFVDAALRELTMEQLNQTMWGFNKPWYFLWAFSVPLGAWLSLIGLLLYTNAAGFSVLKYALISIVLILFAIFFGGFTGHVPAFFGIGGALILFFFIGIIWHWSKERTKLEGTAAAAADFKLAGYVFFLIAAWFICGLAGFPYMKALENISQGTPIHIMIFLVVGWCFHFLSYWKLKQE